MSQSPLSSPCVPYAARVLVVDDHPNTASMLARVLEKLDTRVEVLTARSGEEALEKVGDGLLDVLVTDFMMPGMSGLDLIEKLKNGHESFHTILITAYDTPGLSVSARRLGVQEYLTKPVQPEKIREIVARFLEDMLAQAPIEEKDQGVERPAKILVADDYQDNIRLLSVRLQSEGYDYIIAKDGEEALRKAREEKPDLLLLDVNMPRKDGFEVLAELRADPEIQHIPVIMITAARIGPKDVRDGLMLGADDYVTKPLDWRELAARIQSKLRVKKAEDVLRRRNRELGMLPKIGRDLSASLDVQELAQVILHRTVETLGECHAYLALFWPGSELDRPFLEARLASAYVLEEIKCQMMKGGLFAEVLKTKQAALVYDTKSDKRWEHAPEGEIQSAICVPLVGRNGPLGALTLAHEKTAYFNEDHLALVQAIANQAAIAVENAQYYETERRRVDELAAINQISRRISLNTHSAHLIAELPAMIHQVLNYPTVVMWENQDGTLQLASSAGREHGLELAELAVAPQQAVAGGKLVFMPEAEVNGRNNSAKENGRPTHAVIAAPLMYHYQVVGVLSVHSPQLNAFKDNDRVVVETLAAQVSLALERIKLFESVEQEQRRMAAVLRGAADAILVLDARSRLELANPAGERLFTDVNTQVGLPLPDDSGYDDFVSLLAFEEARQGQVSWPDGRTFSVHVTPIEEGGKVAILHDVSHFTALNQLKNEFIATASHDLKNPIFAVLGYSDLLRKAGPLNDLQADFVERIRNSAVQMQDLVLNLLEISRIEMGVELSREKLDLGRLAAEEVEQFRPQAEARGQTLKLLGEGEAAWVNADRSRLQQVVRNLVGNALKYTPDGGRITVEIQPVRGYVQFAVQDTGIGIAAEDLPRLFEKFFRVHSAATEDIQGNGLGLAIVKSIVEKHGGTVQVDSALGHGSCFSFHLPAIFSDDKEKSQ